MGLLETKSNDAGRKGMLVPTNHDPTPVSFGIIPKETSGPRPVGGHPVFFKPLTERFPSRISEGAMVKQGFSPRTFSRPAPTRTTQVWGR